MFHAQMQRAGYEILDLVSVVMSLLLTLDQTNLEPVTKIGIMSN